MRGGLSNVRSTCKPRRSSVQEPLDRHGVGTRSERIRQIEFWTPTGRQEARRARLIYTPGASDRPAPATKPAKPDPAAEDEELTGDWVQTDIFSLLTPQPASSTDRPVETVEPGED